MQLHEIVERLNLTVVSGQTKLDQPITVGYVSDILSDVMAKAPKGSLWITTQTHENVVAILFFKGLAGVILAEGQHPDKDALEKAVEKELALLLSDQPAFEIAGKLYELGLRGK